jgi:hypothetical protein
METGKQQQAAIGNLHHVRKTLNRSTSPVGSCPGSNQRIRPNPTKSGLQIFIFSPAVRATGNFSSTLHLPFVPIRVNFPAFKSNPHVAPTPDFLSLLQNHCYLTRRT